MNEVIEITNLSKSFKRKIALNNISLKLQKGKVVGILGENGAGKTTLIKIIANLYKKDSGEVLINNIPVSFDTHKYVSYMPDNINLYEWMKVKETIQYYEDMFSDFDKEKAKKLCQDLKINENDKLQTLSRGMKERVMLMLTFSRKTVIYLLDEPVNGIDPVAKDKILKTIIANISEDSIVILSTHLIKDTEKILDEVIFIKDGEVKVQESCDVIREQYKKSIEEYYLEVMDND